MKTEGGVEINCSAVTLLGPTTLPLLELPVEGWVMLAQKGLGYDGLGWRPLSKSLAETQIRKGLLLDYAKAGIHVAEQSYRGEKTWQQASQHANKQLARVSYLMFPHRTDSLRNLVALQLAIGDIPTTVYPTQNAEEEGLQRLVFNKLVQPSTEAVNRWGVTSFNQLIDEYHARELGITLDLFHYFQMRKQFPLPPMKEALQAMYPLVRNVQFGAKRFDIDKADTDTNSAYQDLLNGTANSEAAQMLVQLLELGYQGPVETEVGASAIGSNPLKIFQTHKRFVKGLEKITKG